MTMERWLRTMACAFAVAVLGESTALSQWRQVATMPTSRDLWGVGFATPDLGFVAGESHELHRTTDGGATWTRVSVPGAADDPIYDVLMLDQSVGFCTSNSTPYTGAVYRTTNGGATWEPTSAPLGGSWYHLDFVSSTVGFAGSNGGCIMTTDQGLNWVLQSGYPTCPVMFSMDFRDASVGLVGGLIAGSETAGIFKTTDGGKTWVLKYPSGGNGVAWLDAQTAIADDGTGIVVSTDSGETWQRTTAHVPTGLSDLTRVSSQAVVGVGFNGTIWYSPDRGKTFSKRVDGIGSLPGDWSVRFSDPSHGWVVGTNGIIYRSSDGGLTWSYVTRGLGTNWYAMAAFGDRNVVAGGLHGYVAETFDTGARWSAQIAGLPPEFGRDTRITDMQVLDWTTMVAVGDGGSFLKSTDRGRSWRELGYPRLSVDYFINGVEFTDPQNGWMVGFDLSVGPKGYVRRTQDGGQSWQIAEPNVPSIDVEFAGKRGFILTTGSPLWRSSDGGQSWASVLLPDLDGVPASPSKMSWPNGQTGYVCGWYGYLAKSTNGGATWTPLNPHLNDWVNLDIVAPTPNEVWMVSSHHVTLNNRVMRSLDGGATWDTWKLGNGKPVPTRVVRTGTKCYVPCFGGEVFVMEGLPELPSRLGSPQRQ
jgi:photosystem II stability/assembly factor-like uncharacterized protein